MYTKNMEKSETLVEVTNSKGEKFTFMSRANLVQSRKKILSDLMAKYDPDNLRFIYMRSAVNPDVVITIVSNWKRQEGLLEVGFSFCSTKEVFSRREGKIACFEHMAQPNHPFVATVPWLEDGLLSVFLAFNRIAKPIKLSGANFRSLYFNNPGSMIG